MTKDFWINLPVKNVQRSKEFFIEIGFPINKEYGAKENSASFFIGQKNVVLMLFDETTFKGFINGEIADTRKGTEVLLSIDTESKEKVDEIAQKAIYAGGKSNHKPSEMKGWIYGCVFSDLDGHMWNVIYMD